jgi:hypothetical protein
MANKWFLISASHKIEIGESQEVMACIFKAFTPKSVVGEEETGALKLQFDAQMTKAILRSYLRANFGSKFHIRDLNPEITAAPAFAELARKTVGGPDVRCPLSRNAIASDIAQHTNIITVDFRPR